MKHSVKQKTSSGSVDTATAKKGKNFFFIADWIWFILNCCFDWSKSHCCCHWNESKDENTFDHIHFVKLTDGSCWRLNLILIILEKFLSLIYDLIHRCFWRSRVQMAPSFAFPWADSYVLTGRRIPQLSDKIWSCLKWIITILQIIQKVW